MKIELNCPFLLKSVARQRSITFGVQQFSHAAVLIVFGRIKFCDDPVISQKKTKTVLLAEKCIPRQCHLVQYQRVKATHDVQKHENPDLSHMAEVYSSRLHEHFWYSFPNGIGNNGSLQHFTVFLEETALVKS